MPQPTTRLLGKSESSSPAKGKKIPDAQVVKFVLKEVMRGRKFNSQKGFAEAVASRLRKTDPAYSITGQRLRSIALTSGVKIAVRTRDGKAPKKCPVCGHGLKKTHFKNLAGKKLLASLSCTKCSYKGKEGKWAPGRYEFFW